MAYVLNQQSGSVEQVPDDQVAELVASGAAQLPKGRVAVVAPDGTSGTIDEAEAAAAFRNGFRFQGAGELADVAEEKTYGDRSIAAGLAGLARGATLGLSDAALTQTGLVEPRTLEGIKNRNVAASVGGEVAGTVAGLLIPGAAPGLVAKAGLGAERLAVGALGKVGAKVAAGALEGSLYGIGNAVSESALGDVDLSAEKLVSSIGVGALLGAGGGLLGGALDAVLGRRAAQVAEGADFAKKLGGLSEAAESASKAVAPEAGAVAGKAAQGADAALPTGAELQGIAERHTGVIKRTIEALDLNFPTPEQWVLRDLDLKSGGLGKLAKKELDVEAPRILLNDARYAAAKTAPQKMEVIQSIKGEALDGMKKSVTELDQVATRAETFDSDAVADRIREQVIKPLGDGPALNRKVMRTVEAEAAKIDHLAWEGKTSFEAAEKLKRSFDAHLKWDAGQTADTPIQAALKKVRGIINGEIEEKAAVIARRAERPELLSGWHEAKDRFGAMAELEKAFAPRLQASTVGNRFFSLTDNLLGAGGLVAGGPAGLAAGLALGAGNKWARERLPHIIALTMRRMESEPGFATAAKAFHESVSKAVAAGSKTAVAAPRLAAALAGEEAPSAIAGGLFGRYGPALANAAARGTADLLATHVALSGSDDYRQQMAAAGFGHETQEHDTAALGRASHIANVGALAAAHDAEVDRAVKRFLGSQSGAVPKRETAAETREARLSAFKSQTEKLAELAANPDAIVGLVQPGQTLSDAAPAVAASASATAAKAIAFLQAKMPADPNPATIPALARAWAPTDSQLSRWERHLAAVNNPQVALQELKRGAVSAETVEALKAVYPKLLVDLQQRVVEHLAEHSGQLSTAQRRGLSTLLEGGSPADQHRALILQNLHRRSAAAEAQKQAAQTSKTVSKTTQGYATASQRVEGR